MTENKVKKFGKVCVYKIKCNDCKSSYVGQTSRSLRSRMYEHEYNVRNCEARSVLASHCEEFGHSFDFKKPKVLAYEASTFRREFLEMYTSTIQKTIST